MQSRIAAGLVGMLLVAGAVAGCTVQPQPAPVAPKLAAACAGSEADPVFPSRPSEPPLDEEACG